MQNQYDPAMSTGKSVRVFTFPLKLLNFIWVPSGPGICESHFAYRHDLSVECDIPNEDESIGFSEGEDNQENHYDEGEFCTADEGENIVNDFCKFVSVVLIIDNEAESHDKEVMTEYTVHPQGVNDDEDQNYHDCPFDFGSDSLCAHWKWRNL